jgi:hypothetical protein
MQIEKIAFQPVDWSGLAAASYAGEAGTALWRTLQAGNIRARIVEYSPGYVADHWCEKGHVVFVLEGEIVTELRDGRTFVAGPGQGYVVADGDGAHRSRSVAGARLFIVD